MNQALYAHMNNKRKMEKKIKSDMELLCVCVCELLSEEFRKSYKPNHSIQMILGIAKLISVIFYLHYTL
jgi:hypothetical protein